MSASRDGAPHEEGAHSEPAWPATVAGYWLFALLAVALFGLFHGTATVLGSDRGQHGVLVALVVVAALVACERMLSGLPISDCVTRLGLGAPRMRGLVVAAALAVLLLVLVPLSLGIVGVHAVLLDGWRGSLFGLFAQAGVAEEALFRGFLFRRLRPGRSFRGVVVLSGGPFVLAHLPLFAILPWQFAAVSLGLAVATSFSLARLFEWGGSTIWPPAVLHFVVQATVKIVALDELPPSFPVVWMIASAVVPMVLFLDRGRRSTISRREPAAEMQVPLVGRPVRGPAIRPGLVGFHDRSGIRESSATRRARVRASRYLAQRIAMEEEV